jgi:DNA-binding ferritin-like protein
MIGEALINLSDIANCVSGDFHAMHLNFRGVEFDTFHKKILKKYYEQSADDFDSWAEAALMFIPVFPNGNKSAERIEWQSIEGIVTRDDCINRIDETLEEYLKALTIVFIAANAKTDCYLHIGVANTLQTRIEYWSKELAFFNKRRIG